MKSVMAVLVLAAVLGGCATLEKCSTPDPIVPVVRLVTGAVTVGCVIHEAVTQTPAPAPTPPRSNYCQEFRPDDPTCEVTK